MRRVLRQSHRHNQRRLCALVFITQRELVLVEVELYFGMDLVLEGEEEEHYIQGCVLLSSFAGGAKQLDSK